MTIPEDFKTRLKIAKSKIRKQVLSDSEKRGSFMGNAFKLGTELVASVAVGTIIGFILDTWFDTKPWLIIIFFFMASNPMQQFSVHKIGPEIKIAGIDFSFTNASLFMVISAALILFFLFLGTKEKKIIPDKLQLIAEIFYSFVAKMISDTAGSKAKPYFPFIFSLFMFVLFCNMVGMLPYSFTVTSHIIVTLILALFIFIAVTIIGFAKHGFKYLSIFVPSGVPAVLLPLITIIEIISYLSRPVSLSVRLFANMMAGHTMLKVFGGFVISLGILGGWLPLSFSVALTGLEILVAFLQAYVFAILTCIYLNDALNLHH
jgi:F-type H+-transporting ATPase subunit a